MTKKWECDFDREMNENPEMRDFLEIPMIKIAPLDPRDAFFGGRTGNIVTRYKITGTEKIRYVDVCSLYPYDTLHENGILFYPLFNANIS